MQQDPKPLPTPPDDAENLRRLRAEAERRMRSEELEKPYPAPVYGGPPRPPEPAPVYGGAPVVKLRWSSVRSSFLIRAILIGLAVVAAIVIWLFSGRRIPVLNPAPVYGGPPPRAPAPPAWLMLQAAGRFLRHFAGL